MKEGPQSLRKALLFPSAKLCSSSATLPPRCLHAASPLQQRLKTSVFSFTTQQLRCCAQHMNGGNLPWHFPREFPLSCSYRGGSLPLQGCSSCCWAPGALPSSDLSPHRHLPLNQCPGFALIVLANLQRDWSHVFACSLHWGHRTASSRILVASWVIFQGWLKYLLKRTQTKTRALGSIDHSNLGKMQPCQGQFISKKIQLQWFLNVSRAILSTLTEQPCTQNMFYLSPQNILRTSFTVTFVFIVLSSTAF